MNEPRLRGQEPELEDLAQFLVEFGKESDRGAALTAAAVLDEKLAEILAAFLANNRSARELLTGFGAPLGTMSARVSAAHALGLIEDNEYREINLIRKIRNEFGHSWRGVSLQDGKAADLCRELPWLGPAEYESTSTPRARLNAVIAILLTDLLWRVRLVRKERRTVRSWPNRTRGVGNQ